MCVCVGQRVTLGIDSFSLSSLILRHDIFCICCIWSRQAVLSGFRSLSDETLSLCMFPMSLPPMPLKACWGYRHMLPFPAFTVGSEDLNPIIRPAWQVLFLT